MALMPLRGRSLVAILTPIDVPSRSPVQARNNHGDIYGLRAVGSHAMRIPSDLRTFTLTRFFPYMQPLPDYTLVADCKTDAIENTPGRRGGRARQGRQTRYHEIDRTLMRESDPKDDCA